MKEYQNKIEAWIRISKRSAGFPTGVENMGGGVGGGGSSKFDGGGGALS